MDRCQGEISCVQGNQDRNSIESKGSIIDSIPLLGTIYRRTNCGKQVFEVQNKALLTDGETLRLLQDSTSLQKKFVELAQQCRSVLCYRVAPLQKVNVCELRKQIYLIQ